MPPADAIAWTPYCGAAPAPADWLGRWNLDPWLLAALAITLVATAVAGGRARVPLFRALAVAVLLFVSPLCALTSALFSARTLHHLLLVAAMAPLLAWSLSAGRVRALGAATLLHVLVFWLWHAPAAYGWALSSDPGYWAMQASLLGSAVWFWAALRSAGAPARVAALLAVMVAMGLVGAVLVFAGQPLYAPHLLTTAAWGLSPLEDQQWAGLVMWAPAALIYLGAALVVLYRGLGREADRRARPA